MRIREFMLSFVFATFVFSCGSGKQAEEASELSQSLPGNIYQGPNYKGGRQWSALAQWSKSVGALSTVMPVPGYRNLYMNPWTGQYYTVTPDGAIDLQRSGQNYDGSLAAWNICMDHGGGDACYSKVDHRIKTILQVF